MEQKRVLAGAAAALSRAMGTSVWLRDVAALSDDQRRNLILRATLAVEGASPRSVIIKATRADNYDPAATDAFAQSGLIKEWIATAFLSGHAAPGRHSPAFLAGDSETGSVVLEDLGADHGSLVGPLLDGPADRAERALLAYAASLGRMHADTLGCADNHSELLHRTFPASRIPRPTGGEQWRREVVAKVFGLLDGPVPEDEIAAVAQRMAEPGPWLGLAHRDACPDNVLLIDGRARLIDFEFAGPGHILLDTGYWRMGFPTCWCAGRLPDAVTRAMDRAYRAALGEALPDARDDAVIARELALLLFTRLFASLAWLLEDALKTDERWGISTNRARLLWHLEAAGAGAEAAGTLGGLAATARRWRAELGARWPEVEPLALYPAFTS